MAGNILTSADEMRAVEQAAIDGGVASAALMEAAGARAAEILMRAWTQRSALIVCGPGNNGGDGFVVARLLKEAGWPVTVALIGEKAALQGDAKLMADLFDGEIAPFSAGAFEGAGVIVDAIFGTGLSRDVEGVPKDAIDAMNAHPAPVLALDLPSGVNADTGAMHGVAVRAARTVTFHAKKPGHVLFPGRALSGAVDVVDIGIGEDAARRVQPRTFENQPALWGAVFRRPNWMAHKYHRGHVFVVSGPAGRTGAARLAAAGAQRVGAGLTTVLSPSDAISENAAHLTSIMVRGADSAEQLASFFEDKAQYPKTALVGPGAGVGMREKVIRILKTPVSSVLDADALTSFADNSSDLFSALRDDDVLTPHGGEFVRLFGEETASGGRLEAARTASEKAGCIVILKGADTVIAAPDGRAAINVNAPADLAIAGSGDVLAGFVAGLKAQGMPAFEAAAAGVWFHGAAAQAAGPGLIPEDLVAAAPTVLRTLLTPPERQRPEPEAGG